MLKNIQLLKAKTYHVYEQKLLYRRNIFILHSKLKIECLGGESMTEENKLVFIEPEDVPRLIRGATGKKWLETFDKIPKGKVLAMTTEDYGSAPNIRGQVKGYNKIKGNVLTATQRTNKETEEVTVYVQRVK